MTLVDEQGAREWVSQLPGVDSLTIERCEHLVALLREENSQQNLVSAASLDAVWMRHIADSAQLLTHVPRETAGPWLDLGTGAGFPGLVIAILKPSTPVVMIESRAKRVEWLMRASKSLALTNATVQHDRLERRETFPALVISARAFAPLHRLLDLSARFSTAQTHWLLPKGRSAQQELDTLRGWNHTFHVEQSLTDADSGVIVGQLQGKKGR